MLFADEEYFKRWGFKLTDYCLRTIRQRIKRLLGEEGVEPANWENQISDGLIRAPGRYTKNGRVQYETPQGAPLKKDIILRAEIRANFSKDKSARKNLPALPGLHFDMIKFSAPGIGSGLQEHACV